jgi:uncharacterized protein (DUF433 family)
MTLAQTLVPVAPPLRMNADGVFLVGDTRVTLDTVIGAFNDGSSADEIALAYDTLSLADVHAVIGHYLRHTSEVDDYLETRLKQSESVRKRYSAISATNGIRERLLARRGNGQNS